MEILSIFFLVNFFQIFFIVVQVQLSPFSCHHFPPPHPPPPTTLIPILLWLCQWVLYTCSLMTLPFLFPIIPLPSGYCQFALHFNVSGYILLACFVYFLVTQLGIFKISHNLSSIFVFLAGKNHKNVY